MKGRIAGITQESIVDGVGIRYVVFVQGCPHHCRGCHNPETHSMSGGYEVDSDDLIREFSKNPVLRGITVSGGEPFANLTFCLPIIAGAHKHNLDVWVYTGYTLKELLLMAENESGIMFALRQIDVLVDGRFVESLSSDDLLFKGSSNQRIINMRETLKAEKVILWNPEE